MTVYFDGSPNGRHVKLKLSSLLSQSLREGGKKMRVEKHQASGSGEEGGGMVGGRQACVYVFVAGEADGSGLEHDSRRFTLFCNYVKNTL